MNRFLSSAMILVCLAIVGCAGAPGASTASTPAHSPPAPVPSPPPLTSPTQAAGAGADLFRQNCAPCHGLDRQGDVGPNLTAAALQSRGRTDQYIRDTITNGRGGMPSWKDKMYPAQIEALITFLRS